MGRSDRKAINDPENALSWEDTVLSMLAYYQTNQGEQWTSTNSEVQKKHEPRYREAFAHLKVIVQPQIKRSEEQLIATCPAHFFWDGDSGYKQGAFDQRPYVYKYGTYGTGYPAQTNHTLYIVSLRKLTKAFRYMLPV